VYEPNLKDLDPDLRASVRRALLAFDPSAIED
jgi:hypothetical protein